MHVTVFRVDAHCAYIYMMMWNPTGMVLAFSGLLLYAYVQVIALVSGCMCVSVCTELHARLATPLKRLLCACMPACVHSI